jgi:hypothetical protein
MRPTLLYLSVALLAFAPVATADVSEIVLSGSTDNSNPISGKVILDWNGTNLEVTIWNTSSDSSVITGFGLMGGTASLAAADFSATGTLDDSEWFAANALELTPYDTFDFGGDTPPTGLNSGDPNAGILAGIEAGDEAIFQFDNLNSSLASAADFLNTANSEGWAVALRYQRVGANGEDSGKLVGIGTTVIPAPGAATLGVLGISMLILRRRND